MTTNRGCVEFHQVAALPPSPPSLCRSLSDLTRYSVPAVRCSVCLEYAQVRARNLCPMQCDGGNICLACSNSLWEQHVRDTRYVVAMPRCVGCRTTIASMDDWRKCMPGEELFARWKASTVLAAFVVRCPSCDEDCSFWPTKLTKEEEHKEEEEEETWPGVNAAMWKELVSEDHVGFRLAVGQFERYEQLSAKHVVDQALEAFGPKRARALLCPLEFRCGDEEYPGTGEREYPLLAELFTGNVERQATVLLEWLRRPEAMVSTPCCLNAVCFACKFDGWHEGETCAEVVSKMMEEEEDGDGDGDGDKVFHCPQCLVPCVHAGGCSAIRCLCGHEYHLNEEHE